MNGRTRARRSAEGAGRRARFGLIALSLIGLAACASGPATPLPTPQLLRIAATDLAAPRLLELVAAYTDPSVAPFVVVLPQSALRAELETGRAAIALTTQAEPDIFATPLGHVRLAVIAHPANPAAELGPRQIEALFTGRLALWPVPGAEGRVLVVVRPDGSDAALAFGALALGGEPPSLNALVAPTWTAMRELVAQNPGAIGYLPESELDASVKRIESEVELSAPVIAVALGEPQGAARDFLAWAQAQQP